MLQIKRLSDTQSTPNLNILIYGPPGVGKTRFSGTVAKVTKPLILSAESGLLSLRKLMKELDVDFDYHEVTKFEDIEEAYQYLRYKNENKYGAVILDSLTEIQQVCMDKILRDEKIDKARIQDWGTLNNRMVSMVRSFRDLDLHVIATALASNDRDEASGVFFTGPYVQGRLKETLAGYFDEVLYACSTEVKDAAGRPSSRYWLQTQGTTKTQAKDRSGCLPRECPADFSWIYNKISQGGKEETK